MANRQAELEYLYGKRERLINELNEFHDTSSIRILEVRVKVITEKIWEILEEQRRGE